jgi:hypothetical protein
MSDWEAVLRHVAAMTPDGRRSVSTAEARGALVELERLRAELAMARRSMPEVTAREPSPEAAAQIEAWYGRLDGAAAQAGTAAAQDGPCTCGIHGMPHLRGRGQCIYPRATAEGESGAES